MASFEERVKAAWEAWGQSIGYSKGGVATALRAADATEPEIGAVRRWLAGETVDEATLPERLREVLRERDEERVWMADARRSNIRMRAALDEIAVCCGRDGDADLKALVDDVKKCIDGMIEAGEKIDRLTQERDEARAEADVYRTKVRVALDHALEPGVEPYPLPVAGEPPLTDRERSLRTGGRIVPDDERVRRLAESRDHTIRRFVEVERERDEADKKGDATRIDAVRVDQPPLRPLPPLDPHDHACPINPPASACPTCGDGARERAAELCRKHENERPPCSDDEDGCWMCSYEGAVASMDGFIDSTVRAEQERDALAAKVREQDDKLDEVADLVKRESCTCDPDDCDCGVSCDGDHDPDCRRDHCLCCAVLDVLYPAAAKAAREAGEGIDATPPERVPTPEEAVVLRRFVTGELEVPMAHVGTAPDDCEIAEWTEWQPDETDPDKDTFTITPAGRAALARFDAQEAVRDPTPDAFPEVTPTRDDWRARALAAEAEVARLRAALERATREIEMGEWDEAVRRGGLPAVLADRILAARRAEAMGGSDADA